jgi:hypothetical protein
MAHFAKINSDNIVEQVVVVDNDNEHRGNDFLNEIGFTGKWVKTSYNTLGGKHSLGGDPLRKNYASIGYFYDEHLDAFIPPKPFNSWVLDQETCLWKSPIEYPENGSRYIWNEVDLNWQIDMN